MMGSRLAVWLSPGEVRRLKHSAFFFGVFAGAVLASCIIFVGFFS